MPDRQLATVRVIGDLRPIDGADLIELALVDGWSVVVKKGEVHVGQAVCYFEIDSFLPLADPRFAFLEPRGHKTVDGVLGHVLRTAKLRGVYSQGLVIPLADFPELLALNVEPGADVTETLGITKYEPPIPANLAGLVIGEFPTRFAPKTDAERVQNLVDQYDRLRTATTWYATEKVDGTSVTFINDGGQLRVCSRNLELARTDESTQWQIADRYGLLDVMSDGMVVQGEIYGDGIQKNPLGIKGQDLVVFAVLVNRRYLPRADWPQELRKLAAPIYADLTLPETVAEAVAQVDGIKSLIAPARNAEGVVWHAADGAQFAELDNRACLKAISNKYLLKTGG